MTARRTLRVSTATGDVRISLGLFELASRCGATVLFSQIHLRCDGELVGTLDRPPESTPSAVMLGGHFSRFLQGQAELV